MVDFEPQYTDGDLCAGEFKSNYDAKDIGGIMQKRDRGKEEAVIMLNR